MPNHPTDVFVATEVGQGHGQLNLAGEIQLMSSDGAAWPA